jgi:hypothetical protein
MKYMNDGDCCDKTTEPSIDRDFFPNTEEPVGCPPSPHSSLHWCQFSLGRLLLMVTCVAVYIAMLKAAKFPGENPFVMPVKVLEHPYSPGRSLGIAVCILLGASIAATILFPNRFTIGLIVVALVLWFLVGELIFSAMASC